MLLLGVVVAMVFGIQVQLPAEQKRQMAGSLLWLAIFFAGMLALDRSFAAEREDGCWEGLLLYPLAPATIYLAKLAVNVVCLAVLELLLVPLFVVLADVPLLAHPWAMLLVALLGNLGIAAVGTLLGALTAGLRHGSSLSALLILPMVVPVVLAAAEATRLWSRATSARPGGAGPNCSPRSPWCSPWWASCCSISSSRSERWKDQSASGDGLGSPATWWRPWG